LVAVCATLDDVRAIAARAPELAGSVRAVVAPFIPSGVVALLSGVGIAAIELDEKTSAEDLKRLRAQKTLALPAPAQWAEGQATTLTVGGGKVPVSWRAKGVERAWAGAGTARGAAKAK
jgi:aconitate hydratase